MINLDTLCFILTSLQATYNEYRCIALNAFFDNAFYQMFQFSHDLLSLAGHTFAAFLRYVKNAAKSKWMST